MRGLGVLTFAAAIGLGFGGSQLALVLAGQGAPPPEPVQITAALAAAERNAPKEIAEGWPSVFDPYVPDPPKAQSQPKAAERWPLAGFYG